MVKLRIGKEEIVYNDKDLQEMSIAQLKQLKRDLNDNIENVSVKKSRYIAENNEPKGSKEYFKVISKYKTVIACLKHAMNEVNSYMIEKQEDDFKNREHWLWSFYVNSKHILDSEMFDKLISVTDERTGYHVAIGE
jgi:hypothetical protein